MYDSPMSILVVEHGPQSLSAFQRAVAELPGARVEIVHMEQLRGHNARPSSPVDLVLVDPDASSARLARTFTRIRECIPGAPIMLLGEQHRHRGPVVGLRPEPPASSSSRESALVRAVRYAVARRRLEQELPRMALIDDLTGLLNRRGFFLLAQQQLRIAKRLQRRLLLCYFDLDGLKRINDEWGHAEGDRALTHAAKALESTFRDSDVIGRVGGDEFIALALDEHAPDAGAIQQRLRAALHQASPGAPLHCEVSLSLGVARYGPGDKLSIEELVTRADAQLYAQRRRRNPSQSPPDDAVPAQLADLLA